MREYEAPLERLRIEVGHRSEDVSGLLDLGRALVGQPDQDFEQSCATCEKDLPNYVEAELNGQPVRRLFPTLARHLDLCSNCTETYVVLLDVALQTDAGLLNMPAHAPAPDLSFLPALSPAQGTWWLVQTLAEELLRRLRPEFLPDLPGAIRNLKDLVSEPGAEIRSQWAPASALGLGPGLTPAMQSLVAAYNATGAVLHEMSAEKLADDLSGASRRNTIEKRAQASARATGLRRTEARQWAEYYFILAQDHAEDFLRLARQVAKDEQSG